MLRLWCVTNGDARYWRASLQDVHTGKRHGSAGLGEAMAFMRQQLERLSREGLVESDNDHGAQ
jgi:hypothetical protein